MDCNVDGWTPRLGNTRCSLFHVMAIYTHKKNNKPTQVQWKINFFFIIFSIDGEFWSDTWHQQVSGSITIFRTYDCLISKMGFPTQLGCDLNSSYRVRSWNNGMCSMSSYVLMSSQPSYIYNHRNSFTSSETILYSYNENPHNLNWNGTGWLHCSPLHLSPSLYLWCRLPSCTGKNQDKQQGCN